MTIQGQLQGKSGTTHEELKDNSWSVMDNIWTTQGQSKSSEKKKKTNLPQANLYD